ncbi:hypothetical protein EYF80_025857 [Liparis tanakae]|uniref:Uncharacterized protein n=1 Tax=Liparis tanakae TaxID=230148 RepID=A0A4Z2HG73_9TELE|nr:hypothetical protein EYF80_025857 [Liparis tanakae]
METQWLRGHSVERVATHSPYPQICPEDFTAEGIEYTGSRSTGDDVRATAERAAEFGSELARVDLELPSAPSTALLKSNKVQSLFQTNNASSSLCKAGGSSE